KHKRNGHLTYLGDAVYDDDYSALISSSKFSLGFLSKHFPEYHTTRTFEILACGTALLTERTPETLAFFKDDEVIFYKNKDELIEKIKYYKNHDEELEHLINKGREKVVKSGYDYHSILSKVLQTVLN
ncbi:MAG: glycosyltransferase, partial [Saprospiraceae bacterium]